MDAKPHSVFACWPPIFGILCGSSILVAIGVAFLNARLDGPYKFNIDRDLAEFDQRYSHPPQTAAVGQFTIATAKTAKKELRTPPDGDGILPYPTVDGRLAVPHDPPSEEQEIEIGQLISRVQDPCGDHPRPDFNTPHFREVCRTVLHIDPDTNWDDCLAGLIDHWEFGDANVDPSFALPPGCVPG